MKTIRYREGYEYVLAEDYQCETTIHQTAPIITHFLRLLPDGTLWIRAGYAWDGPSGPTIDTPDFMRGSLIHDALYQLMREKLLPMDYRDEADDLLQRACLEDGMPSIRAAYVYAAVRLFGGAAMMSENPILVAPREAPAADSGGTPY